MSSTTKMAQASEIVAALGLDPSLVARLSIVLDARLKDLVTIEVEMMLTEESAARMVAVIKQFDLVERKSNA